MHKPSTYLVFGMNKADLIMLSVCTFFFILKIVLASSNQFLHDWDERFHALVAKNLMAHPLTPVLRVHPVFDYNITDWCCNHIWLHKPPLTLWGMALFLKTFGLNIIALRFLSITVSTVTIWINFRLGKLIHSERLGLIMGIITALSYYHLELSLGALRIDHVDTLFIFLISYASYAYLHLLIDPSRKWVLLTGVLTGLAILTKWLLGLFPFLIFCGVTLLYKNTRLQKKIWVSGFTSFLIAMSVSSVWYIYALVNFPMEAKHEWLYNFLHLTNAVENSAGNVFSYIELFHWQFGILSWPLLLSGIYIAYRSRRVLGLKGTFVALGLTAIYIFFSLLSQTRLPSYVLIASSFVFFYMALAIDLILLRISRFRLLTLFVALGIGYSLLSPHNLIEVYILKKDTHLVKASEYVRKEHNTRIYRNLVKLDLPPETVVINLPDFEDVECMFWTDYNCYHWWPTESELNRLLKSGYHVAAFKDHGAQVLPEYIKTNKRIQILDFDLH